MRFSCAALVFIALVMGELRAGAAEVRLRSSAVCMSSVVRLADVAEIHAGDPKLAAALADVPLCAAPAKGSERQFTQHDVRQLLALSGVEAAAVQVTGSETVTLLTESSGVAVTIKRQRLPLATHRQAAFEVDITGKHDAIARQSAAKPSQLAPQSAEEAKPPRLVERGALCTVHARAGSIRVTTQGKALQAGTLGETISIEMAETKERVLARIVGSQIVEVEVAVAGSRSSPPPEAAAALLPVPAAVQR
jgi:flagella basal body P-ring formation protein FlgA